VTFSPLGPVSSRRGLEGRDVDVPEAPLAAQAAEAFAALASSGVGIAPVGGGGGGGGGNPAADDWWSAATPIKESVWALSQKQGELLSAAGHGVKAADAEAPEQPGPRPRVFFPGGQAVRRGSGANVPRVWVEGSVWESSFGDGGVFFAISTYSLSLVVFWRSRNCFQLDPCVCGRSVSLSLR
jgi:hypothetical protein